MLKEDLKNITINELLDKDKISIPASNCCFNANFNTLFDIIAFYKNGNSFFDLRNAERSTCIELEDLCQKHLMREETASKRTCIELNLCQKHLAQIEVVPTKSASEEIKQIKNKRLIETNFINAIDNKLINADDILNYFTTSQKTILTEKHNKLISNYSTRTMNRLRSIGFEDFTVQYLFQDDEKLLGISGLGKKSLEEAIDLKNKMKDEFLQQINSPEEDILKLDLARLSQIEVDPTANILEEEKQIKIKELIETDFVNAIDNKLINADDILNYFSTNQKKLLTEKYNKFIVNYSIRTMNRLRIIDFEEFTTLYLFQDDKELLNISGLGKKSLEEAVDLKNKMKNEFLHQINLSDEDTLKLNLVHQIGEVTLNNFVFDFHKQNCHLPMFWILEQYLVNDKSRGIDILTSTFNIVQNKQTLSLEEIAEKYSITRERTRQIRNDVFRKTFEITDGVIEYKKNDDLFKYSRLLKKKDDWNYILYLVQEASVNQESFEIQECLKREQSNFSVEFALHIIAHLFRDTFSLFGGFETSSRDRIWENTFLIRREFADIFNFDDFIEEFKNHIIENETEYELNIDDYLANSACWASGIDLNKFDKIVSVVRSVLLYEFCLYSNFDGLVTIPATKERCPLGLVYEILQQNGNPMHIEDIFVEFKKILPEHKYLDASQLRPYLQKNEAITYRNRKSVYTLKEWDHIKSGTIRNAIVEFLSMNDLPQTANDITDYVLQHFPKTNIASVRTTMFNDTQKRFSFFDDSLFGLVSKEYPSEYGEIQQQGQRKAFEQRLYDLEKFLSENDHFPFSTSDNEDEISLYRWWRLQNRNAEQLSEQQKMDIERVKKQYVDLEIDRLGFEWFLQFNKLKLFVLENRRLPLAKGDEKFLYGWLRRAKHDFINQRLNEKQRRKYAELFKEINYAER